jgi:hypothetical protein
MRRRVPQSTADAGPRSSLGQRCPGYAQPKRQSCALRLSGSRGGRVLLHIATLARSRKHFRWHLRFVLRNVLSRHSRKSTSRNASSSTVILLP